MTRNLRTFASLWIGYLLQSTISVQFATLALWGWVFLGLVMNKSAHELLPIEKRKSDLADKKRIPDFYLDGKPKLFAWAIALVLGIVIGVLPLRATMIQKSAYESRNLALIISSATTEPLDADRMNQTALLLARNQQIDSSLRIVNKAVEINPRSHDAWTIIFKLSPSGSADKDEAKSILEVINPFGVATKP